MEVLSESKYNRLFIEKFKVNSAQLHSEFARIVIEHGQSEEIKLQFYLKLFETIIAQFKQELPKDENYDYIISTLYQLFIKALEEDNVDCVKLHNELDHFRKEELPSIIASVKKPKVRKEPVYKQYNLNTKYGRRKAREQALSNYENGTPEYRRDIDNMRIIAWVIIGVIAIIFFLIKISLSGKH